MITARKELTKEEHREINRGLKPLPPFYISDSLNEVFVKLSKEKTDDCNYYISGTDRRNDETIYISAYCQPCQEFIDYAKRYSVYSYTPNEIYLKVIFFDDKVRVFMDYQKICGGNLVFQVNQVETDILDVFYNAKQDAEDKLDVQRQQAKENSRKALQPILADISKMKVNGNRLELPKEYLENYRQVNKVLTDAGGKYKKNGFEFKKDVQEILDRLLGGEKINDKQKFQFFETQPNEVKRVQELADVQSDDSILEPSAGHGALVDKYNRSQVEVMELNPDCREVLEALGFVLVGEPDFLANEPTPKYDKILANPPFTKSQDIKHIKHMYDFLKPNGRLVSIASTSWQEGNQKLQKDFRAWLKKLNAHVEQVDAGAFKKSGTSIPTTIIVIDKEAE